MAQDEGQAAGARGLEDFQIGSTARHAEEARDLGPEQPLDDQLGDGGHASECGYAPASRASTGRIRSSALRRLASEFA